MNPIPATADHREGLFDFVIAVRAGSTEDEGIGGGHGEKSEAS
jgi:hypothetical protein